MGTRPGVRGGVDGVEKGAVRLRVHTEAAIGSGFLFGQLAVGRRQSAVFEAVVL